MMVEPAGDPFAALADEHRRSIVRLLRDGERSVGELADELPISRPAVSRHLRLLKEAGLVNDRASGTQRFYRLEQDGVDAVRSFLEEMWGDALRRFKLFAENASDDTEQAS